MSLCSHVRLMASYNEWMNGQVYAAAGTLPEEELTLDRQAFFGSILGTLNHLVVADTIWLKRFCGYGEGFEALAPVKSLPMPASLDQILHADLDSLRAKRRSLDHVITALAAEVTEADLEQRLHYSNTKGVAAAKNFFSVLMHFFNHQTHHRGQVTTLLFQAGVDVGVTDLIARIPNEGMD